MTGWPVGASGKRRWLVRRACGLLTTRRKGSHSQHVRWNAPAVGRSSWSWL